MAREGGIRLVEDSLDVETCEGAATIGLELVNAPPTFVAVLIALGGGALATGVGHVVKAHLVPRAHGRLLGRTLTGADDGTSGPRRR